MIIPARSHSEKGPSERGAQLKSSRPRGPGKPLVYSALSSLDHLPGKAAAAALLAHAEMTRYTADINASSWRPGGEDEKERVELAIILPPEPAWADAQADLRWLHAWVMHRPHDDYTAALDDAHEEFRRKRSQDPKFRQNRAPDDLDPVPVPRALDREIDAILKRRRGREKMEADRLDPKLGKELGNLTTLDPLDQARTIAVWRHRMRKNWSRCLDAELRLYAPRRHRRNRAPSES